MKWTMAAAVAAALAIWAAAPSAHACSCLMVGLEEELAATDLVFTGRAAGIQEAEPEMGPWVTRRVVFEVTEVLWGEDTDQASVYTNHVSASCGVNFVLTESYVVFAMVAEDGTLRTSLCSRTSQLGTAGALIERIRAAQTRSRPALPEALQGELAAFAQVPLPTLTGIWHASPVMAAGWNDAYLLYEDGRYEFRPSQMACPMPQARRTSGTWAVEGQVLRLSEERREEHVLGLPTSDAIGCGIEGGVERTIVHQTPLATEIDLAPCEHHPESEEAGNPMPCLLWRGRPMWRFSEEPGSYGE